MKNKSVTYLLGAVVLLIWGLVFYRFFSAANEDDLPMPVSSYSSNSKVSKSNTEADSFELISDYRDPFLGLWTGGINSDINNAPRIRKKVAKEVAAPVLTPIDWSFVSYLGTIHGKQSNKKLAILKLNDREMMVGANDKVGELTVLKIGKDSVLVSFRGVSKVLR